MWDVAFVFPEAHILIAHSSLLFFLSLFRSLLFLPTPLLNFSSPFYSLSLSFSLPPFIHRFLFLLLSLIFTLSFSLSVPHSPFLSRSLSFTFFSSPSPFHIRLSFPTPLFFTPSLSHSVWYSTLFLSFTPSLFHSVPYFPFHSFFPHLFLPSPTPFHKLLSFPTSFLIIPFLSYSVLLCLPILPPSHSLLPSSTPFHIFLSIPISSHSLLPSPTLVHTLPSFPTPFIIVPSLPHPPLPAYIIP